MGGTKHYAMLQESRARMELPHGACVPLDDMPWKGMRRSDITKRTALLCNCP